jgi:uncharacterized membrane protein (UPF0127 family)
VAAYDLVRVVHGRTGQPVADECKVARGLVPRILGLHLLPRLRPGEGLLLKGATTIDTAFMRYSIDLVFLDRDRRVRRIVHDMEPWRMVVSGHGGRDCLELPAGAARASGIEVDDHLTIEGRTA